MTLHEERGRYERCPACRAPVVIPFPLDWVVDLIKRGPRQGPCSTTFMPHTPGCIMRPMRFGPNEGASVRVPGTQLAVFDVDYDRWAD